MVALSIIPVSSFPKSEGYTLSIKLFPKSDEAFRGNSPGRLSTDITVMFLGLINGRSASPVCGLYPKNGSAIVDAFTVEAIGPSTSQLTSAITVILNSGSR